MEALMKNPPQKLTLSRETLRTLQAPPTKRSDRDDIKYPTTTVLTRRNTCTCY